MSTDNREDYLINILRLTEGKGVVKTTELANYMNVSPASVTEMLKVLKNGRFCIAEKNLSITGLAALVIQKRFAIITKVLKFNM